MNNLTKAKAQLVLDQPFFASILFSLPLIEDKTIKTLATNGDEIRYNPEFVGKLSLSETVFVLAHETLHSVFQHMDRRGDRDPNRWNIAGDYLINATLVRENIGSMPQGCLYDPGMQAHKKTTEEIYKLIPESQKGKKPGDDHGNGGSLDDVQDSGKDEATISEKREGRKIKIAQAANAAKSMGKLSAGMSRFAKQMTRSKSDWKAILRNFMTEKTKTDWSYAKPKRRFLAEDIYLPGLTGEKMDSVVIAVDCSGSVDDELLAKFAIEVKGIIQDVSPTTTHVIYFDSEVLKHDQFAQDDVVEINAMGGGGTDFAPIWDYVREQNLNPAACVVLTDMCGTFGEAPDCPVLWAATTDRIAPFGDTIRVEE